MRTPIAVSKRLAGAFLLALACAGGAATFSLVSATPADAQYYRERSPFLDRRDRWLSAPRFNPFGLFGPRRDYYYNDPRYRPDEPRERQAVDSSKAPAARKSETPPTTTIAVFGASMADWLAYGLEEAFADTPEVGVVRNIRPNATLIHNEQRREEWLQTFRESLASESPDYVVVILGLADRQPIKERIAAKPAAGRSDQGAGQTRQVQPGQQAAPADQKPSQPGQAQNEQASDDEAAPADSAQADDDADEPSDPAPEKGRKGTKQAVAQDGKATIVTHEFRSERWSELYAKRVDAALAIARSKGVPVLWVGLPVIRGTRSKSEVSYLNELYRGRVEKAGAIYVDVWDGFVDEDGNFMTHGPDYDGQIRRLRTGDGVHFTKAGAVKLGRYVEREIKRLMLASTTPLAMPSPDPQTPGSPGRAAVGPVVPLTGAVPNDDRELVGAGTPRAAVSDPLATRVLVRGEAAPVQSGRADDFTWPRPGSAADPNEVVPFTPPPAAAVTPAQLRATKASAPADRNAQPKRSGAAPASAQQSGPKQVRQVR